MWCQTCHKPLCRMCIMRSEHPGHQLKTESEAKDLLVNEVSCKELVNICNCSLRVVE